MELCSQNLEELSLWMEQQGEKKFRAKQVFQAIYHNRISDFSLMTSLPLSFREKLQKSFLFPSMQLVKIQEEDETKKFLWKLCDGYLVESVLIQSEERRTVCVSSQVGCKVSCAFCASGKKGWKRNLSSGEILEQVLLIQKFLSTENESVSQIVFMGMGEPLENYDNVVKAIRMMISPEGFGLSARRISLSTVGVIEGIHRLGQENLKINLVLSLHAPNQEIRQKLIPYAYKYLLPDLLEAMDQYFQNTGRDLTYEYVLFEGVNDSEKDAYQLSRLLQKKHACLNLIPYNPIEGGSWRRPKNEIIERFQQIMIEEGIPTTWRYTKGKDISAACGQLALQDLASRDLASRDLALQDIEKKPC
ncbi:MAG: 23S rRNA (adenine(2503)-C(2))-methyltransferase RlmN [Chlamydiota bacterium]